jgi:hypothetical protein
MNDYYSKYLKYKNKYIKLKELKVNVIKEQEIDHLNKNNSAIIRGINCPFIYCEINKTFPFNFCLSNEI